MGGGRPAGRTRSHAPRPLCSAASGPETTDSKSCRSPAKLDAFSSPGAHRNLFYFAWCVTSPGLGHSGTSLCRANLLATRGRDHGWVQEGQGARSPLQRRHGGTTFCCKVCRKQSTSATCKPSAPSAPLTFAWLQSTWPGTEDPRGHPSAPWSDGARSRLLYRPATSGTAPGESEGAGRAPFLQEFPTQTRSAEPQAFPFLPGRSPAPRAPRPGFPRRCLAAPEHAALSLTLLQQRGLGVWAPQLGGKLLFRNKNKRLSGRAAGAPAPRGGHKGALDACDLSSQTEPSASQGSQGDDVANHVCAGPAPASAAGVNTAQVAQAASTLLGAEPLLGTESLPAPAFCVL